MTEQQEAAMRQALKFVVAFHPAFICEAMNHTKEQRHTSLEPCPHVGTQQQVAEALRQALEQQPDNEPDWKALVLNHNADCESRCDMDRCGYKPYFENNRRRCPDCPVHETIDVEYTRPQPAAWVGLTDEEIEVIYEQHHNQYGECESVNWGYERAIEAALRSKNT